MIIFESEDYKEWTNSHIGEMAKGGWGQYARLAEHLRTTPTIVTQVFHGDRDLTPEQSILVAEYFALSKLETRFLLLMVNYARAGSVQCREVIKEQLDEIRKSAKEIKSRVPKNLELSTETKATLYSNWYYLAIWSLTAIKEYESLDAIIERLQLNKKKAREALDFLLENSLVVEVEGKLKMGPSLIHLESDSPHLPRHHQSWRNKAFQRYNDPHPHDVSYTAPITLSEQDAVLLHERVVKFVGDALALIKESPSEKLYCLCMDWFEV